MMAMKSSVSDFVFLILTNVRYLITIFQFLQSKICLMTMGDLGNFHLKKNTNSTNPTKYIYLPHTPVSAHMVDNKDYYKNFDVVLCTGPQFLNEQKINNIWDGLQKSSPSSKHFEKQFHRWFDALKTIKLLKYFSK